MNYIKQVNTFYKLIQDNPLSSNAQCLYNYLLNKCSELSWKSEFSVSNLIVCGFTNLSRQALDRARNELVQKGYIEYRKGYSNQCGKYLIVSFDTQNNTQEDTQDNTQSDIQDGHSVSTLNKLNKTKQKNKENKKEKTDFDSIVEKNFANEDIKQTIFEFIKMRKAIKKPLTTKGLELMIQKLNKLSQDKDEQIMILNKSIMNNWQGIFELKDEEKKELENNRYSKEYKEINMTEEEYIEKIQNGGKKYV